jgi:hypothetical protein
MARRLTNEAIRGLLKKGLTGWETGKLILQDLIDSYHKRDSVLTEADMEVIRHAQMKGADVREYNMFMALCRGFHVGYMLGEWTCVDACLHIISLEHILRDVDKSRTVELFESFGPRVVTRKQYEDIVAVQRKKKLKFEYCLGYVIEERFYVIAPVGAREEIDGLGIDIVSAESFAAAVPEKYANFYKQSVSEIQKLYVEDKLKAVYDDEDIKVVEPLLNEWKKQNLSDKDLIKLVDMLFVTGQQLHDCDELPEWKDYIDNYNQYIFGDEDERLRYSYAILEDCPKVWLDERGYYKKPTKPSEWVTRGTELHLGLINNNDKTKKSIQTVGA